MDAKQWLPLVKKIAKRHSRKCDLEYDELYSYGMLGLAKALATFDASRGVPLGAYIARKVDWAVLDGMSALIEQNVALRGDELGDIEHFEQPDVELDRKRSFIAAMGAIGHAEREHVLEYLQCGSDAEIGNKRGISRSWAQRMRHGITKVMLSRTG